MIANLHLMCSINTVMSRRAVASNRSSPSGSSSSPSSSSSLSGGSGGGDNSSTAAVVVVVIRTSAGPGGGIIGGNGLPGSVVDQARRTRLGWDGSVKQPDGSVVDREEQCPEWREP